MVSGKHRLTAKKVENAKKWGYLSDGAGLYLKVRKSGAKTWAYIWTKNKKRNEMSLGSAAGAQALTLADARKEAGIIRTQISAGLDPMDERRREAPKTFAEVAAIVGVELAKTWKSPKSKQQWDRSIEVHCKPIHYTPVNEVSDMKCRSIVIPVWEKTPETGRRLRKRIERVLNYADAHGWREGPNPARWDGHFKEVMVRDRNAKRANFPAMPYAEVPAFIAELQALGTIPAMALEFLILTATRSSETLNAQWSEIDMDKATWSIPKERMKNGLPHDIPLTDRALQVLHRLYEVRQSEYVFPGKRPKKPLSNMTLTMLMRRMGYGNYVPHGFRAAFRTFCGNETNTPREVAEAALSHLVGDSTELAYSRGNALEKRRRLMPLWADHCAGAQAGEIVRLHG